MAKQIFKVDIDLEQNELLRARVQNETTSNIPANPKVGQIYYDTTLQKMGVCTSTGWLYFVAGSGGGSGYLTNITSAQPAITVVVTGTVAALTIALATTTQDGLMSKEDKTKLNNATSANTNGTLVERNASGVISVTNVTIAGTPSVATDAATKGYVDGLVQGLKTKLPARVIATSNITLSGVQSIDGVSVIAGNRVLVTAQSSSKDNGIYLAQTGAWTRAVDLSSGDHAANVYLFIEEGNVNADTGWVCTTNSTGDVVGTDALAFVKFSSAGVIEAGAGLIKTGNTLNIVAFDNSIVVGTDDIRVKIAPNSGIQISGTNGIGVIAGNGIDVGSGGVTVKPKSDGGITVASGGVSVKGDGGKGIEVGTGGVAVKRDSDGGIGVTVDGLVVNPKNSGGIVVDGSGVAVKADAAKGIILGAGGVGVNVDGTDVVITSDHVTVGGRITKTVYKDVSLVGGTPLTITHGLNTLNVQTTIIDQSGGEQYILNVKNATVNTVVIDSNSSETVRVIISGTTGAGL